MGIRDFLPPAPWNGPPIPQGLRNGQVIGSEHVVEPSLMNFPVPLQFLRNGAEQYTPAPREWAELSRVSKGIRQAARYK